MSKNPFEKLIEKTSIEEYYGSSINKKTWESINTSLGKVLKPFKIKMS